MKKILFLSAIVVIACSCAVGVYEPWARNNFGAQTTVVLDKANFRVVRNVEAVVEVNNSNLKRKDVEKSAYAELLRNARLTGSQVLTNVVVEEVYRKGTFSNKQYVAARATIIEFIQDNGEPIQSTQLQTPHQPQAISSENSSTQSNTNESPIQSDQERLEQKYEPTIQPKVVEQRSEFQIKADVTLNKAKSLINYYKNSGKHYTVFKTFYKEVAQAPTKTNVDELELCNNLLWKYHTDKLDYKDIDSQLKKANDIKAQEKILIDEAKKQANL